MSGLPNDGQTKRENNKVCLLPQIGQGETPQSITQSILKTTIGQCLDTRWNS
jgi:hypothetical protein